MGSSGPGFIRPDPDHTMALTDDKRYELFQDFVKTIFGLSTGALLLTVTFLHDILGIGGEQGSGQLQYKCMLGLSWLAFLLSVLFCLGYLFLLANEALNAGSFKLALKILGIGALAGLLAGLVLFGLFGWLNLPA